MNVIKKTFVLVLAGFFAVLCTACSPVITVNATNDGGAKFSFKTGFSKETTKTLRTISGVGENEQLFSAEYMEAILKEAGGENVAASVPSANEIETSALIKKIKESALGYTGVLSRTSKSLTLTIGPEQFLKFYNILTEDSKSYFDMLMIPALIGETMNTEEYRELLSSMYGPSFANELVDGKISITLTSPDGKKVKKATSTLGEILTLREEKSWTVSW